MTATNNSRKQGLQNFTRRPISLTHTQIEISGDAAFRIYFLKAEKSHRLGVGEEYQ